MKRFFPLSLLAALMLLAGCDTFSSAREKFGSKEPARVHHYATEPRVTYEAARRASEQMGYRFVRGGAAQGELDAISGIGTSDTLSSSRQISLSAKFDGTPDGGTDISLWFKEITEGDSADRAGQALTRPLRNTPQYEVFFRTVQQVLDTPKKP
jgi:hypothetical protein